MNKENSTSEYNEEEGGGPRTELPYLTAELPGIGGAIKTIPSDFFVEEVPLYECSGEGTHVLAYVQKKNMTTMDMIAFVAQQLNVRRLDVGYAGRKDSKAVTRQWISIEHIDPKQLERIETKTLKVLKVGRHNNKLRIGHLKGNRFMIRLRQLALPLKEAAAIAEQALTILNRRGVPNYFGPQRFGYRNDSHLLGAALVKNDLQAFYDTLLGKPEMDVQPDFIQARKLYEEGRLEEAFYMWHSAFGDYRRALKSLIRNHGNLRKAFRDFDHRLISLFLAAWQSELFNQVLTRRMPNIDKLLKGDMAYKHDNGACFRVEDAAVEQPRCDVFDISPTGPLPGTRMTRLTDEAGQIENPVIDPIQIDEEDAKRLKKYGAGGGRRPLRFQPNLGAIKTGGDEHGEYLELHFELPSGCYATVLLREITK
ncbi:MAG: tRNA pseudouridine(13) synthase TruD [Planctomycetaceae bacterium]|nr:tRNA pseudouridine(13) synthase TruD [Planctomycetaceae bacterium]